jgi:putative endonuclease
MKFYFVYVLLSQGDQKFYIGITQDVERRLQQHNEGKNSSTSSRRPFLLIYFEAHLSGNDALRRESYFKTPSGKCTLRQMLRHTLDKFR